MAAKKRAKRKKKAKPIVKCPHCGKVVHGDIDFKVDVGKLLTGMSKSMALTAITLKKK